MLTLTASCVVAIFLTVLFLTLPDFAELVREKCRYQSKSYAPNSATTRAVQVRKYLEFIGDFAETHSPLPCPSPQVALYATWLARKLKYSSVLNYLSGLNNFLRQNGSPPITYTDYEISSTLRGIRRERSFAPRQALPLLPAMLRRMLSFITSNPGHVAWRAALLCSFRALLRKCQVTLSDSSLLRKDFKFYPWGLLISIRRSKTIQFRERVLQVPVARCPDTSICAVHWTKIHFDQVPAPPDSMAFLFPLPDGGSTPLPYPYYQATLKHFAARAGMDPDEVSSHSLRRGGCTFLSMTGASLEELRARGDWSTDTVFTYLKTPLTLRILNDIRVATALATSVDQMDPLQGPY